MPNSSVPEEKVYVISDPSEIRFEINGNMIKILHESFVVNISYESFQEFARSVLQEFILKEKYSAMIDMASVIAHEIKNPLFALKNKILSLDIDEESKKSIKSILDRIDTIITNITIFVKGQKINMKKENLESILEDTIFEIEEIKEFLFPYQFSINREYSSDKIFIMCDRFLLKRAFSNIILNAIESVEKSPKKEIFVRTYDDGSNIVCEIEDTGCGILPEMMKKIFLPFLTTKTRGIGLGMSVVKKVADLHNAKLEIDSEPNKGTKVKMIFSSC